MIKVNATQVQLRCEVAQTPEDIRRRYRKNLHWRYYPKEWIYKNVPLEGKEILDFGCGTGEITTQLLYLGAKRVYALDVTPGLVDCTRRRAELDGVADRVETICGTVQDVDPKAVDIVIAYAVLHHCFPLETVVPRLVRWLKPGGLFIAVEPVCYVEYLEQLRNRSGVAYVPLDEGERKLNRVDLQYVLTQIVNPKIVHFHILGRLARLWPGGDRFFRRLDHLILHLPMSWKLSGTALIVGRRP